MTMPRKEARTVVCLHLLGIACTPHRRDARLLHRRTPDTHGMRQNGVAAGDATNTYVVLSDMTSLGR